MTGSLALPTPRRTRSAVGARRRLLVLLALALAGVMLAALGSGALPISPGQALAILADRIGLQLPWSYDAAQQSVLLSLRAPRVVLAVLVGAALSTSGAATQGLFRNPLADPALLGVSGGAALCAVLAILLGYGAGAALSDTVVLAGAAFVGGLAATLLVVRLAGRAGQMHVGTLLLAGMAINALCFAGVGLGAFLADDAQLRTITFWNLGSLGGATWNTVAGIAVPLGLALVLLLRQSRALNVLLLGESDAAHLGLDVDRLKRRLVLGTALATGAAVAVSGMIAFVGLVVPHLIRLAAGPDHRLLLPASALLGALLLVAADLVSRTLAAPAELPIGTVTALCGAPFFLALLLRRRPGGGF